MRAVANNLILHLHPTKVARPALRFSYTWGLGGMSAVLVIAFNFTKYLLPWDQLAFWAITKATSLLRYLPVIGPALAFFFLGGPEVGQSTLRNFYATHVAVLPVLLSLLMSYHFWKVRKDGASPNHSRIQRLTHVNLGWNA